MDDLRARAWERERSGVRIGPPQKVAEGSIENGEVRPLDVKVGDNILFGKYSGTEVKVDGDELLVMREEDVMAVIEK